MEEALQQSLSSCVSQLFIAGQNTETTILRKTALLRLTLLKGFNPCWPQVRNTIAEEHRERSHLLHDSCESKQGNDAKDEGPRGQTWTFQAMTS